MQYIQETSVKNIPNPTSTNTSGIKFSVPTDFLGRGIQCNNPLERTMRERLPINGADRTQSSINLLNIMVLEPLLEKHRIISSTTVQQVKMPNINSMEHTKTGSIVGTVLCRLLMYMIARDKID
jgi:hypothetical protein